MNSKKHEHQQVIFVNQLSPALTVFKMLSIISRMNNDGFLLSEIEFDQSLLKIKGRKPILNQFRDKSVITWSKIK